MALKHTLIVIQLKMKTTICYDHSSIFIWNDMKPLHHILSLNWKDWDMLHGTTLHERKIQQINLSHILLGIPSLLCWYFSICSCKLLLYTWLNIHFVHIYIHVCSNLYVPLEVTNRSLHARDAKNRSIFMLALVLNWNSIQREQRLQYYILVDCLNTDLLHCHHFCSVIVPLIDFLLFEIFHRKGSFLTNLFVDHISCMAMAQT